MSARRTHRLVPFLSILSALIAPAAHAEDQAPARLLSKTPDNIACGRAGFWDLSGADLTYKVQRNEIWVIDSYSEPAPFLLAFTADNLQAPPRRIALTLPVGSEGAAVLGIAEFPHGDFAGKNLILFDTAFGAEAPPQPTFGIFNDDGMLDSQDAVFPVTVSDTAVLAAVDIHPERDELVVYDMEAHAFYVLDFSFSVISGPVPLLGFQEFFAGEWGIGNSRRGGHMGLAYGGPDTILASSSFRSLFTSSLVLEYDAGTGIYTGRALDLAAAGRTGNLPDLVFGSLDTGISGVDDALFILNMADESVYAFLNETQDHAPPVDIQSCGVDALTGAYQLEWTFDRFGEVDSIRILENGVEVASLGPDQTSFTASTRLSGKTYIEVVTEKGGFRSSIRPVCELEDTDTPGLPGVTSPATEVINLGELTGVAVTREPATPADFRAFLMGRDTNRVLVLDHTLEPVETLILEPAIVGGETNVPARGIALAKLGEKDVLALLDGDGPNGTGVPAAGFFGLDGPDKGNLLSEVPVIDMSRIVPRPSLLDWDADADNNFVAAGVSGRDFVIVKIAFDGRSLVATDSAPFPHRSLTPFLTDPLIGIGVSVLPSGNYLVAGADTFSNTFTEALLTTPFTGDPATSVKLVGLPQGLIVPSQLFGTGPGHGPFRVDGFDTAYFAQSDEVPEAVGVTYLSSNDLFVMSNPALGSLFLSFQSIIHAETMLALPTLVAEQLTETVLEIPGGETRATPDLSPRFTATGPIEYAVYVLNRSTTAAAQLGITISIDGVALPEATLDIDMPAGRWVRRTVEGGPSSRISVAVRNLTATPATIGLIAGAAGDGTAPAGGGFRRGDCDASGLVNITDAIVGLNWLFLSGANPVCEDACDSDDSGGSNITDMILILNFLFLSGPEPAPPGVSTCGPDPVEDSLNTCAYPGDVCG